MLALCMLILLLLLLLPDYLFCEGFHLWYCDIDLADFFLLNVNLALFFSSYCLCVEFLPFSKYNVAGECLFLAIILCQSFLIERMNDM